ncbi:proton channel OTOP1-like [Ascaphus truei]|uniref:proton channel OTOP1-like n=1 Tax=Ascaphus truei TaxID=8439 RepID=UPI003F591543
MSIAPMPVEDIKDNNFKLQESVIGTPSLPLTRISEPQKEKELLGLSLPHRNAEISSSQYGINIFLVGLFLMLTFSLNITGLTKNVTLTFLIILMLIQIFWMLWYVLISDKKRQVHREKDAHAGARWLRCGVALFAVTTLVMDSLRLGYFVGYSQCIEVTEGIYPVTHVVHTVLQVYFLWYHSKDIIKTFKTLERFGLIHSVFTNLLLWVSAVLTESKHQLQEHMGRLSTLGFENITHDEKPPQCNCSTNLCDEFSKGIYYIYPFNIEYHILASAMLYVLWKNIGSNIRYHQHDKHFKFQGVIAGTLVGLIVLITTIGIVVIYLFRIGRSKSNSESALTIYYLYAMVMLSIMSVFSIIGLIIYKLEIRSKAEETSPAKKLDAELLVGSACGSWAISWGSILAVIFAESHPTYTWYNLPYSLLIIIEIYVQNLFIIAYIYINKEKSNLDKSINREISTITREITVSLDIGHMEIHNEAVMDESISSEDSYAINDEKQETNSVGPPGYIMPSKDTAPPQWNMKTFVLRNITVVLFFCNISLWIPPAFGCRPQYDNGLEAIVFGFTPWFIIIDIALPFSIFYRMHSAYSLFDVYCKIG